MNASAPPDFHTVCRVRDLKEGTGRVFVVGGRNVAVFRDGGRIHAVSDRCPHNGMSLHDGCLRDSVLTCRWHGWSFHLETGRPPGSGPAADGPRIRVYAVRVRDEQVEVALNAENRG